MAWDLRVYRPTEDALDASKPPQGGSGLLGWLENEALFREQVGIGHKNEKVVAQALRELGLEIFVKPKSIRGHVSQRGDFKNEHDLLINGTILTEVKSRDLLFTGPQDYPYPTAIVDDVMGWDAKEPKPCAVILVSQHTGGMAVVGTSTRLKWDRRYQWDHVRGFYYWAYHVDRCRLRTIYDFVSWCNRSRR